jgi:3-deoxy-7-phosphoheptulonate synthase
MELETGQSSLLIPFPQYLVDQIPCRATIKEIVFSSRAEIQNILKGRDEHPLLVVCGPCSIHDTSGAFDYAQRLAKLASEVREDILLVMRTYFEKPRSIVGWKGLLYDPELEGSSDSVGGLCVARRILASIAELGLPCATEFLNPMLAPYQKDFLSYGSIGARTVESQIHRELA